MIARRIALVAAMAAGLVQEPRDVPEPVALPAPSWHQPGEGRGRPEIDGANVFFLTATNAVVAVDSARGLVRWRAPIGPPPAGEFPMVGPRLVGAGGVIIGGGDSLVALDQESGTRRWEVAPTGDHGLGFYLGDAAAGQVFTGSASGALCAVEPNRGAVRWRTAVGGGRMTVYAPRVRGDEVVAAFRNFDVAEDAGIVAVDRTTGAPQWHRRLPPSVGYPLTTPPAGGPVADEHSWFVSGHDGAVHALAAQTGHVKWSTSPSPDPDFRALVVIAGVVVAGSLSGTVTAYDRETGEERWQVRPTSASVAFEMNADADVIYVPFLSGEVVALAPVDGRQLWRSRSLGGGFRYAPALALGRMYLASTVSGFFSIPANPGAFGAFRRMVEQEPHS